MRHAESLLRHAAKTMGDSLIAMDQSGVWPAAGERDLSERHLSFHLALAGFKEGWNPMFEVAFEDRRIDLVLHRSHGGSTPDEFLIVESKLLYSEKGKVAEIIEDVRKIEGAVASWKSRRGNIPLELNGAVTCCVLGSVWKLNWIKQMNYVTARDKIISYWMGRSKGDAPVQVPELYSGFDVAAEERAGRFVCTQTTTAIARGDGSGDTEEQYLVAYLWSPSRSQH